MRPRIGVTAGGSEVRAYVRAVETAGGESVVLDGQEGAIGAAVLERVHALLFTGGGDIHPRHFGQRTGARLRSVLDWRDSFELELARAAYRLDVPTLGICRGVQVMVVALGGTLIQHIPKEAPSAVNHDQKAPRSLGTHLVHVEAGKIREAMGQRDHCTNSFHHQAARDLPPALRSVAWAEDGIVEAVEADDRTLFVGVQWHPEHMTDEAAARGLFQALVDGAQAAVR